jgi:hypothetical protein
MFAYCTESISNEQEAIVVIILKEPLNFKLY